MGDIVSAYRIENPYLEGRYNTYKNTLIAAGALNGGETLVFHGCPGAARWILPIPTSSFGRAFSKNIARHLPETGNVSVQVLTSLVQCCNSKKLRCCCCPKSIHSALHVLELHYPHTTCLYMMHRSCLWIAVMFVGSAGFYFGQQASKSHEYPLSEMQELAPGVYTSVGCCYARSRAGKSSKLQRT